MHLWNEYEGSTVEAYTLGKLQRSEGRNAFFLTEEKGKSYLLRLTETLNDEGELTARWNAAAAISNTNLQAIVANGSTILDGAPVAWALLEHTDASLVDVLQDRALTVPETKELAIAVAGALDALHKADLIHEHVEPANIFAAGETIKLRCDCVRECVGDFENDTPEAREALRLRDIHDFGLLLVRCLHQRDATTDSVLPSPFDRIVPAALNGTQPLSQMMLALTGFRSASPIEPSSSTSSQFRERPIPSAAARAAAMASAEAALSTGIPPSVENLEPSPAVAGMPLLTRDRLNQKLNRQVVPSNSEGLGGISNILRDPSNRPMLWGGGVVALILAIVLWNTAGDKTAAATNHLVVVKPATVAANTPPPPSSVRPTGKPSAAEGFLTSMKPGWHVIAYTFNYEEQARAKALDLQKRYFALQPQVYTPTGHAPYFVALGDTLERPQAAAIRKQARRAGLPSDTYIRNF